MDHLYCLFRTVLYLPHSGFTIFVCFVIIQSKHEKITPGQFILVLRLYRPAQLLRSTAQLQELLAPNIACDILLFISYNQGNPI